MLMISRKRHEGMVLDRQIHVTIAEVLSTCVLLEVRAPGGTRIDWKTPTGRRTVKPGPKDHHFIFVLDLLGAVRFNRQVEVSLRELRQEKARLGFMAPKHIAVERKEVFDSNASLGQKRQDHADGA